MYKTIHAMCGWTQEKSTSVSEVCFHRESGRSLKSYWGLFEQVWTGSLPPPCSQTISEYCTVHYSKSWMQKWPVIVISCQRLDCTLCLRTHVLAWFCILNNLWSSNSSRQPRCLQTAWRSFCTVCHKSVGLFKLMVLQLTFVLCWAAFLFAVKPY